MVARSEWNGATTTPAKRQLNIALDEPIYEGLARMAKDRGYPTSTYAKLLFEAAYAARCGQHTDRDLDATVAAALLLHGAKTEYEAIATALRIPISTVERIIAAWTQHRQGLAA